MAILTILTWLKNHKRIAVELILGLVTALSVGYGVITHKNNLKLSESLNLALNNIEAYQTELYSSELANFVLKQDMSKLELSNDKLILKIDSVAKSNKIKYSNLTTAATQTLTLDVSKSKEIDNNIITVKDTTYTDSIQYNNLTTVYYSINNDSINIRLDIQNELYLYIYSIKEYKNKKNFLKRLFTLDFKKVYRYKYNIINTNDLLKESSVRIIELE